MASLQRFIEEELKLKVSRDKSATEPGDESISALAFTADRMDRYGCD